MYRSGFVKYPADFPPIRIDITDITGTKEVDHEWSEGKSVGQRGEVFSTRLVKNERTYFFNVKRIFEVTSLNIVESKGLPDSDRFIRQSIIYQRTWGS